MFVSVLAVRGRVDDVQPTALVDLGKPAFRMGIAEIGVGCRAHELKVAVRPEREVYRVRDKAIGHGASGARRRRRAARRRARSRWRRSTKGLLELLPNESWNLLDAMMRERGIEVETSTAQMQVIGKRHFGRKALPAGGGGGRINARELFDTLLLWRGRVQLDERGEARVEVPLNDSLTSFRIVAVADADVGLFGTGEARIRTTQDVMLISGLPPIVREGDRVASGFTVRNATDKPLSLDVTPTLRVTDAAGAALPAPKLKAQRANLAPGEARELDWDIAVPAARRASSGRCPPSIRAWPARRMRFAWRSAWCRRCRSPRCRGPSRSSTRSCACRSRRRRMRCPAAAAFRSRSRRASPAICPACASS